MKKLTEIFYNEMKTICQYCAAISFGIGTFILILYILSQSFVFLILGMYYTIFAVIINILLLSFNTLFAFYSEKYWKNYLINSGILLINIPIASLYFFLVLKIFKF